MKQVVKDNRFILHISHNKHNVNNCQKFVGETGNLLVIFKETLSHCQNKIKDFLSTHNDKKTTKK